MTWSAGHCEGLTMERVQGWWPVLDFMSIPTDELILDHHLQFGWGIRIWREMLGKNLDCSPGSDIFSRLSQGKLGEGGFERESMGGVLDSTRSPGHDYISEQVAVFKGFLKSGKPKPLIHHCHDPWEVTLISHDFHWKIWFTALFCTLFTWTGMKWGSGKIIIDILHEL